MLKIGTVLYGQYRILKVIGRGGMSTVYLALDIRSRKYWAIKEVLKRGKAKNDEIAENGLIAEAKLIERLDHNALPRIIGIYDEGSTIYIIMDYIEGDSMDKILQERGVQSEEDVINYAMQICDVLSYPHNQKPPIIYRDMKPSNIMLKPDGNVKLIDFGIAREYKVHNIHDTTVLGTRGYAPPEQYVSQTDARSDIYALGMTMFNMLTCIDPTRIIINTPVRQYDQRISKGLGKIIDKCLQPAVENRYQNCADLMYDLQHPELITKGYKKKQKRKLGTFIAAAALAGVMAISGFVFNSMSVNEYNNEYETLINVGKYEEAVAIYPDNPEAYSAMLDEFGDDNVFTQNESNRFLGIFNANKVYFDTTDREVADLYYKAGMLYMNYYDVTSYSTKVNSAFPYFDFLVNTYEPSAAGSGDTAAGAAYVDENESVYQADIAECYYHVTNMYKNYLSENGKEEVSQRALQELVNNITICFNNIENAGAFDRLMIYNCVFDYIYANRNQFTAYLDRATVIGLFDRAYEEAMSLQNVVTKQYSKDIINNMKALYPSYYEGINNTYNRADEG